ncbi:MAG: MFS transporter [Cyanobacteria bacterium P01_C01_bin.89]
MNQKLGLEVPQSRTLPYQSLGRVMPMFLTLIFSAAGHAYFVITFPAVVRQFGFGDLQGSLIMGLSALLLTISEPLWGLICERKGRRFAILIGAIGTGVSIAAIAAVYQAGQLQWLALQSLFIAILAMRLLHTAISGGLIPAAQAVVADLTSTKARTRGMGILGASFGIGTILGGMLALVTGGENLIFGFYLIALLLLITSALLWSKLPETSSIHRMNQGAPLSIKNIAPFLITTLLSLLVYSLIQQVTVLRLQDDFGLNHDASIKFSGGIMMLSMVAMIFSQLVLVAKLKRPPIYFALGGGSLAALAMAGAAWAPNQQLLLLSMVILGLGLGVLLPGNLALLSLSASKMNQAKAAGLNGFSKGLGMAAGPVIGASLHAVSVQAPYLLGSVLFVGVTIMLRSYRSWLPSHQHHEQ